MYQIRIKKLRPFLGAIILFILLSHIPAFARDETSSPNAPASISSADSLERSSFIDVPSGMIITGPENGPCKPDYEGALRYSRKHKALMICDGNRWWKVNTSLPESE